jgi:hypothetical protein
MPDSAAFDEIMYTRYAIDKVREDREAIEQRDTIWTEESKRAMEAPQRGLFERELPRIQSSNGLSSQHSGKTMACEG